MSSISNTSYISATDSKIQYTQETTTAENELDKNAFLNLLVTQLKYQDPLNPTDDKEFLAQMAQFSSLEQMQNLNRNFEATKAFSLLGKDIQATITNDLTSEVETIQGKVDFVKIKNGNVYLVVDNKEISIDDVEVVTDSQLFDIDTDITNVFELIGEVVQVKRNNPETNETEYIEGKVTHINMENGVPYIVIGSGESSIEVTLENLEGVIDKESLTGKKVIASFFNDETGENEEIEGEVEYILVKNEVTYVIVDGKEISIKDVEKVFDN
ncbi:flagellar hook capping FlgD N-terminal domain-containing protein [Defluviitalea phaphyphila]|uniref:flagellar hook capping FlgD N-terminal domain-containing protein n=1 Tax=Defluviitalea phaphyphila TaxID=1473580 RepID=UPI0007DC21D5|nr:flagellar hook capping FlgD N-terminal domain-containing protein [Defluviitalea phaphyphila]